MTKEEAGKIIRAISADKNVYVRDCNTRVAKEDGKIIGAEYMYQKLHDILATEVNSQESDDILESIRDNCRNSSRCKYCKYLNTDTLRCKFRDIPKTWEIE